MAMTGAMSAAISGMKNHMQALNVVGNNIANVNTYGYKTQRITFKESIYNTLSAGSGGTATMGSTNPGQIGYGCTVGTIDLDMNPGDPFHRPGFGLYYQGRRLFPGGQQRC